MFLSVFAKNKKRKKTHWFQTYNVYITQLVTFFGESILFV
ncbi:hypothetical protein BTJ45_03394 [Bacillus mycoides]|nr:hypothetical protein BTJ45_03394 [Bacillus mycoides]